MSNQQSTVQGHNSRHRHEGPGKHIIAFIFSIVLTVIAFVTVAAGEINQTFTYIILIGMAIAQVFIQMAFWMHMKDRGHFFAIVGIFSGAFVALLCVIMALYWVWW